MEVQLYEPFRTIVHDFFSEEEIDWIIDFSKPKLLAGRIMQSREKTILETSNKGEKEAIIELWRDTDHLEAVLTNMHPLSYWTRKY